MSDPLQGISEDVRFNHAAADALASACDRAAAAITSQDGERASWTAHALVDFTGHYSDLFRSNGRIQAADATLLASRLKEVAEGVRQLSREATSEQQRRETARKWKSDHDNRGWTGEVHDFFLGEDKPLVGPPAQPISLSYAQPDSSPRQPLTGTGASGTSSVRPENLDSFATNSEQANQALAPWPATLRQAAATFTAGCGWGSLDASSVWTGFDKYLKSNGDDVTWAKAVAMAFRIAGGTGGVRTVSNAALDVSLKAAGVQAQRTQLQIEPPQALGAPPTTGYANDPVNSATGNFLKPELDLSFSGGNATLEFTRMYNSLDERVGSLGRGWSCPADSRLDVVDDGARWRHDDGREVFFPREGDGWSRATSEDWWLVGIKQGHRIEDNSGGRWTFDHSGAPTSASCGPGTLVRLVHQQGRLVRMEHEHGRSLHLDWDGELLTGLRASDGREVRFEYERGLLVAAHRCEGTRRYRWDEAHRIDQVVDADGVVEVTNHYDEQGRVVRQESQHGRTTLLSYLPGNVTVVADTDGERGNTWLHDTRGRLVGIVDAEGKRQSMSYDRHGHLVMVTERDGSIHVTDHDEGGRLRVQALPSGARIDTEWDELDRSVTISLQHVEHGTRHVATTRLEYEGECRNPCRITDATGGVTLMKWQGNLLRDIVDPTGVRLSFHYDDNADLVATTDADGNTARLERDETGRVVAATSPSGRRTRFTHDKRGLPTGRIDPDGSRWGIEMSAAGRVLATVDPYGQRTTAVHDEHGEAACTTDPLGRQLQRTVDDLGNLAAITLPDGNRWQFAHDALSRLVATTDPTGATWRREYDVNGALTGIVDPTGRGAASREEADLLHLWRIGDEATRFTTRSDQLGRVTQVVAPDGSVNRTSFDACGRPVAHVDALGRATTTIRDAAGRVVRVDHPDDTSTSYRWDRCGRLEAVTDAVGATTTFGYDADGLLTTQTDPTGVMTTITRDECGREIARTTPGVQRARWRYDRAGRVVEADDSLWGRRQFTWDAAGQLESAVGALGGVTRFRRDALGQVVEVVDPTGATTRYEYDACGRPVASTDPLGRRACQGHDAAGRLVWQQDATGSRRELQLDSAGDISALLLDGAQLASYHHDPRSRRLDVVDHSGAAAAHTLRWDALGRLVERSRDEKTVTWEWDDHGETLTRPNGHTTRYERDALGRLMAAVDDSLGTVSAERDAAGRLVRATDGTTTQTWRHHQGQLVEHVVKRDGEVHHTLVERDDQGTILALARDGVRTSFEHDAAHQLVASETDGVRLVWVYDAGGRLVAERGPGFERNLHHDAAGQLTRIDDAQHGTTRFTNDAAGRRTSSDGPDGRLEFSWGAFGWLAGISGPGGSTSIHVDALGELARVDDAEVFWNTALSIPEAITVGSEDAAHAPGFSGAGGSWTADGWRTARSSGLDPWTLAAGQAPGMTHGPGASAALSLGAGGQLLVAGLEWMGARAYDPSTRGFLSVDPVAPTPGTSWWANPYSYAGNDPLHALDPLGLHPVTDAELQAYAASHGGALAAANDWVGHNWEYLAGGAMVIAGGALMATGVGGPVGMALVAAGADTIYQRATTGKVSWGEVILTGGLALVGGGAAGWAAKASEGGTMALRTQFLVNGAIGGTGSDASYVVTQASGGKPITAQGLVGNFLGGGIAAGAGSVAGPVGGTVATRLGRTASSWTAKGTSVGANALASGGGNLVTQLVFRPGEGINWREAELNTLWGGGWQSVNQSRPMTHIIPQPTGMTTLKQMSYFGPRTLPGMMKVTAVNTRATYGSALTGVGQNLVQGFAPS